jgi:hypothetical protein
MTSVMVSLSRATACQGGRISRQGVPPRQYTYNTGLSAARSFHALRFSLRSPRPHWVSLDGTLLSYMFSPIASSRYVVRYDLGGHSSSTLMFRKLIQKAITAAR